MPIGDWLKEHHLSNQDLQRLNEAMEEIDKRVDRNRDVIQKHT